MRSINLKLTLVIVVVVFGFLGVYASYKYTVSKAQGLQELESMADRTIYRLSENLVVPLWELDENWVNEIIDSEMLDKKVYGLFVQGEELFVGQHPNQGQSFHPSKSAHCPNPKSQNLLTLSKKPPQQQHTANHQ